MDDVSLTRIANHLQGKLDADANASSFGAEVIGAHSRGSRSEIELEVRMGTCFYTNPATRTSSSKQDTRTIHEQAFVPFNWRYHRFSPTNSMDVFFGILGKLSNIQCIGRVPWFQTEDVYYTIEDETYRHRVGGGQESVLLPRAALDATGVDDETKQKLIAFFTNDSTSSCIYDDISEDFYVVHSKPHSKTPATSKDSVLKKRSLFGAFIGTTNCSLPDYHIQLSVEETLPAKVCQTRTLNMDAFIASTIVSPPSPAVAVTATEQQPAINTLLTPSLPIKLEPHNVVFTRHKCRTSFFISLAASNAILYGEELQTDNIDQSHLIPYWRVDLTMIWKSMPRGMHTEMTRQRMNKYLASLSIEDDGTQNEEKQQGPIDARMVPFYEVELECVEKSTHEYVLYQRCIAPNNTEGREVEASVVQKLVVEEILLMSQRLFSPESDPMQQEMTSLSYRCLAME